MAKRFIGSRLIGTNWSGSKSFSDQTNSYLSKVCVTVAFVTRTILTLYFGSRGSFLLSVKNADLGMLCVKLYIIIPAVHKGKLSAILHCNKMLHNFVTYCGFSEYKLLVVSK